MVVLITTKYLIAVDHQFGTNKLIGGFRDKMRVLVDSYH